MLSSGIGTAVVAGVTKVRGYNNKKNKLRQAKLPGDGQKCTDKCKKGFTCSNEKCIRNVKYNNLTQKSMDKTTLVLVIVLPILFLLLLGWVFAPEISAFFKRISKFKK